MIMFLYMIIGIVSGGGALAPQTVDHRHYFFKTELAYGTYYIL